MKEQRDISKDDECIEFDILFFSVNIKLLVLSPSRVRSVKDAHRESLLAVAGYLVRKINSNKIAGANLCPR